MKREAPSELHGCNSDGDVRPAKACRRESPSTNPEFWKQEHVHQCLARGGRLSIQRDGKGGEVVPDAGCSIVYATSRGVDPHMTVAL
jgi:hypothetical protein